MLMFFTFLLYNYMQFNFIKIIFLRFRKFRNIFIFFIIIKINRSVTHFNGWLVYLFGDFIYFSFFFFFFNKPIFLVCYFITTSQSLEFAIVSRAEGERKCIIKVAIVLKFCVSSKKKFI